MVGMADIEAVAVIVMDSTSTGQGGEGLRTQNDSGYRGGCARPEETQFSQNDRTRS